MKKMTISEMIALEDYISTNHSLINIYDFINDFNVCPSKYEEVFCYMVRASIMPFDVIKEDIKLYDA